MFTGLIESIGEIEDIHLKDDITRLNVAIHHKELHKEPFGASIAINGCCLTVADISPTGFGFDVSGETLAVTNLGLLKKGSHVNLERAMKIGDRLGGHLVSGHVDCTGTVSAVNQRADGWDVRVHIPKAWSPYVIHKGSICIDGTSLTVNLLEDDANGSTLHLTIIPATIQETTIGEFQPGRVVNIEVDMMAKFIKRQALFN